MNIRPATLSDVPIIAEAERQIAKEPGLFCSNPDELSEENVRNTISNKSIYLVAEIDGKVVGHAFLERCRLKALEHVAYLNIAVHLGSQGKGIGKALLEHIIVKAKEAHLEKIQLNVRASNRKAILLYEKFGFSQEGRLKNKVKLGSQYVDDLIMGLNLKNDEKPPLRLQYYDTIPYEDVLYTGISENAYYTKGFPGIVPFSVFIQDQSDKVFGGVSGALVYGSLYVGSLFVDKSLRGQGWGTKLMEQAEKFGTLNGARFITINTMDWEAKPFYEKLGFHVEFTREGYDDGSKMFMLRKALETHQNR